MSSSLEQSHEPEFTPEYVPLREALTMHPEETSGIDWKKFDCGWSSPVPTLADKLGVIANNDDLRKVLSSSLGGLGLDSVAVTLVQEFDGEFPFTYDPSAQHRGIRGVPLLLTREGRTRRRLVNSYVIPSSDGVNYKHDTTGAPRLSREAHAYLGVDYGTILGRATDTTGVEPDPERVATLLDGALKDGVTNLGRYRGSIGAPNRRSIYSGVNSLTLSGLVYTGLLAAYQAAQGTLVQELHNDRYIPSLTVASFWLTYIGITATSIALVEKDITNNALRLDGVWRPKNARAELTGALALAPLVKPL